MTRRCFFVPKLEANTGSLDLPPDLSRQLESVLRAKTGESIELLDADGSTWKCRITAIRRARVTVCVLGQRRRPACESPLSLTLGMGIARPDTMDLIVRQATEMGVSRLAVFRALRSQYGLSDKQAEKKKQRWAKIASEAVCQCGRTMPPQISLFENLAAFITSLQIDQAECYLKLFALEPQVCAQSAGSLAQPAAGSAMGRVVAALGPEGGWDSSECSALLAAGFHPVSLGPRTLRMETAAVALIASLQILWGDMG